jgi:lipopolysaccharide biosynthesis regulator YciM
MRTGALIGRLIGRMIAALLLVLPTGAAAAPDKQLSRAELDTCAKAFGAGARDEAVARCTAALAAWPDNHRASYLLGLAHTGRDWKAAAAALDRAAAASPDEAMYRMWAGVARFEAGDPAAARPHLERAIALNDGLWRARYYLGRVLLAAGDDRLAAEALTAAIVAHADLAPAYLDLAELYQRWGYLREAAQVATAGTKHVTDATARSELWFTVGASHATAQNDDAAIEAFGQALADRPDHVQARAQRGVAYYRKGDLAKAKADLEAAIAAGGLEPAAKQAVEKILREIASRKK